jgi:predicted NBD/HSP70 family sugar kinase
MVLLRAGPGLVEGSRGAAGLVDHLRINDHGPACARGYRGCVSGYATTAAILRAVDPLNGRSPPPELADVGARARSGEVVAGRVMRDAGYAMGCLIATVCNLAGPGRVILSGEGAELFDTLEDSLREGIANVIHPVLQPIPLTVAALTFTDWARGSAVVAIQDHLDLRSGPSWAATGTPNLPYSNRRPSNGAPSS